VVLAGLKHCHGAFLAEPAESRGVAREQRANACSCACDLKGPARWWARFDGLQNARRLGWIASAALAGRRPERVAVTGHLKL
jgi:hypothetical protein